MSRARRLRRSAGALAIASALLVPASSSAEPLSYPGDSANYGWVVTAYFDEGGASDWNCGGNSYSGHKGTDFAILGSWQAMAEGRPVFAAAAGVVETTHDGEPDMCNSGDCGGGGGWGNHIKITHPDGTRTLYAHLKTWSVTVENGEAVACGQQIGMVGSSGNSTGPHLHFEKRKTADYSSITDPFKGPCSPSPGYWISQGAYNSLPALDCPEVIQPWPLLSLDAAVLPIDGQATDFNPEGASAGIFDAYVGQDIRVDFTVSNALDETAVAQGVRVGGELSGHWSVSDWLILDNWPDNACGGDWCPNDSNELPENLPPEQLGSSFALELGPLSPGESKRVELTLTANAETAPDEHARAGLFVANVNGVYQKPGFDAAPDNVDDKQTWGDGDLKWLVEADLYVDEQATTGDGSGDDTLTGDPSTATDGGSATASGTGGASGTGDESDGGSSSGDASAGSATASGGSASGTDGGPALPPVYGADAAYEEGCACRSAPGRGGGAPLLLAFAILGLARPRRRSR
ncbi:MAG: peptidoglycan DD-metalloendopeptidase family protein [Myxococcales bacterium]|nr:peptidoglycan DD-metalloendopeptidase family protein [Myxococcales bacterium]